MIYCSFNKLTYKKIVAFDANERMLSVQQNIIATPHKIRVGFKRKTHARVMCYR